MTITIDGTPYDSLADAIEDHFGALQDHRFQSGCRLPVNVCAFVLFAPLVPDTHALLDLARAMDDEWDRRGERQDAARMREPVFRNEW